MAVQGLEKRIFLMQKKFGPRLLQQGSGSLGRRGGGPQVMDHENTGQTTKKGRECEGFPEKCLFLQVRMSTFSLSR